MKQLITIVALSLAAIGASAQDAKPTAQQTKMGVCNQEAGDKKGDERKAFMKNCLMTKKKVQQEKMKACNADASTKSLRGEARRSFIGECLRG